MNDNNKEIINQKEYTNKFRMKINFGGTSLLLENDNFRKKTLLKLSNLRSQFKKDYFLSNRLKFSNKLFGTRIRKLNYLLMISMYISEGMNMFSILKLNKEKIADKEFKNIFSFLNYQNNIINISSLFLFGNYLNYTNPKMFLTILTSTFIFKSIGAFQNIYIDSTDEEKKNLKGFINNKFPKIFKIFFIDDYFQIPNLKFIDCNEITITKQILSFATVCSLNIFLKSNLKSYTFSNMNLKIPYFNSKHLKMFLWLFVIGKISSFFGHLGYFTLDLLTIEGLMLIFTNLSIINPFYIPPMLIFFIFNPYSMFIFSSTKNNFEDNDTTLNEYKKKGYYERFKIRFKFLALNLFLFSKKIYF